MNTHILAAAIFVLLTIPFSFSEAAVGPGTSGGGDGLMCDDGKLYALDFVLTEGPGQVIAPEFLRAKTGEEILGLISAHLREKIPSLADSLDDFRKFNSVPSPKLHRLWISRTNPLLFLNDQDIDQVPIGCLDQNQKPRVWQTVVRTAGQGSFTLYQRDDKALLHMAENSPLQVSFMYLHEWLRDYATAAPVIRNVNRYLHSASTFQSSGAELRAILAGFGLDATKVATAEEINARKIEGTRQALYKKKNAYTLYKTFSDCLSFKEASCEKIVEQRNEMGSCQAQAEAQLPSSASIPEADKKNIELLLDWTPFEPTRLI